MPGDISVIIPVFNGAAFLEEAVASIRKQSRCVDEIIVVDDGSTDDSAVVASRLGDDVRVVSQENEGPAAARNRGIAMARHDILAFLDADDLWHENKLLSQLPVLEEDHAVDVVLGLIQYFRENPGRPGPRETLPPTFVFVVGCGLYRKRVFERVGGFDETMRHGEDSDWYLRAREARLRMKLVKSTALWYRRHPGNITNLVDQRGLGMIRTLKQSLDRKRSGTGREAGLPDFAPADIIEVPKSE